MYSLLLEISTYMLASIFWSLWRYFDNDFLFGAWSFCLLLSSLFIDDVGERASPFVFYACVFLFLGNLSNGTIFLMRYPIEAAKVVPYIPYSGARELLLDGQVVLPRWWGKIVDLFQEWFWCCSGRSTDESVELAEIVEDEEDVDWYDMLNALPERGRGRSSVVNLVRDSYFISQGDDRIDRHSAIRFTAAVTYTRIKSWLQWFAICLVVLMPWTWIFAFLAITYYFYGFTAEDFREYEKFKASELRRKIRRRYETNLPGAFGSNKSKYKKKGQQRMAVFVFDRVYNQQLISKETLGKSRCPLRRLKGKTLLEVDGTKYILNYPIMNAPAFWALVRGDVDIATLCDVSSMDYENLKNITMHYSGAVYTNQLENFPQFLDYSYADTAWAHYLVFTVSWILLLCHAKYTPPVTSDTIYFSYPLTCFWAVISLAYICIFNMGGNVLAMKANPIHVLASVLLEEGHKWFFPFFLPFFEYIDRGFSVEATFPFLMHLLTQMLPRFEHRVAVHFLWNMYVYTNVYVNAFHLSAMFKPAADVGLKTMTDFHNSPLGELSKICQLISFYYFGDVKQFLWAIVNFEFELVLLRFFSSTHDTIETIIHMMFGWRGDETNLTSAGSIFSAFTKMLPKWISRSPTWVATITMASCVFSTLMFGSYEKFLDFLPLVDFSAMSKGDLIGTAIDTCFTLFKSVYRAVSTGNFKEFFLKPKNFVMRERALFMLDRRILTLDDRQKFVEDMENLRPEILFHDDIQLIGWLPAMNKKIMDFDERSNTVSAAIEASTLIGAEPDSLPAYDRAIERCAELSVHPSLATHVNLVGKLREHMASLKKMKVGLTNRNPPLVVVLLGSPGVGKTAIMDQIISFYSTISKSFIDGSKIGNLSIDEKHPAEAIPAGAKVLVLNDIVADHSQDKMTTSTSFGVMLQQIMDTVPLFFPQAAVTRKGISYNSVELVFMTTNARSFVMPENTERLQRRFDEHCVIVEYEVMRDGVQYDYSEYKNWDVIERNKCLSTRVLTATCDEKKFSFVTPRAEKYSHVFHFFEYMRERIVWKPIKEASRKAMMAAKCNCGVLHFTHYGDCDVWKPLIPGTCVQVPLSELPVVPPSCVCGLPAGHAFTPVWDHGMDEVVKKGANATRRGGPIRSNVPRSNSSENRRLSRLVLPVIPEQELTAQEHNRGLTLMYVSDTALAVRTRVDSWALTFSSKFYVPYWVFVVLGLSVVTNLLYRFATEMTLYELIMTMFVTLGFFWCAHYVVVITRRVMAVLGVVELAVDSLTLQGIEVISKADAVLGSVRASQLRAHAEYLKCKNFVNRYQYYFITGVGAAMIYRLLPKDDKLTGKIILSENIDHDSLVMDSHRLEVNYPKELQEKWNKAPEELRTVSLKTVGTSPTDLLSIVKSNTFLTKFYSTGGGEYLSGYVMVIDASWCMSNWHYFVNAKGEQTDVVVEFQGTHTVIGKCDLRRVGDTEVVLFRNPLPQPCKDLKRFFPEEMSVSQITGVYSKDGLAYNALIRHEPNGVWNASKTVCCRGKLWSVKKDAPDGDCGNAFVAETSKGSCILGIVSFREVANKLLGQVYQGGNVLLQSDVLAAMASDPEPSVNTITNTCLKLQDVGLLSHNSEFRNVPTPNLVPIGSTGAKGAKFHSDFKRTTFYDFIHENNLLSKPYGIPTRITSVIDGKFVSAFTQTMKGMTLDGVMNSDLLRASSTKFVNYVVEGVHKALGKISLSPTSLEGSFLGDQELDVVRCNFQSSVGPEDRHYKSRNGIFQEADGIFKADPYFVQKMQETLDAMKRNHVKMLWVCGAYKDEIRSLEKLAQMQIRLFYTVDLYSNQLSRMYLLPIVNVLLRFPFLSKCFGKMNSGSKEWDDLFHYLDRGDVFMDLDFKNFDISHSRRIIREVAYVFYRLAMMWYRDEEAARICYFLVYSLTCQLFEHKGDFALKYKGLPSGHIVTLILNSIVNILLMIMAFDEMCPGENFFEEVFPATVGDDNIAGISAKVKERFNLVTLQPLYASWGYNVTSAKKSAVVEPFVEQGEMQFLKRAFRFDEELGQFVAPLETDSVYKMLAFYTAKGVVCSYSQRMSDCFSTAQREMFLHGKTAFLRFQALFKPVVDEQQLEVSWFDYDALKEEYLSGSSRFMSW